jgi:hypothetical protein
MARNYDQAMEFLFGRLHPEEPEVFAEGLAEIDDDEVECQNCHRGINLYDEPAFVVGIYLDNVREEQQRWCRECAVQGMKAKD